MSLSLEEKPVWLSEGLFKEVLEESCECEVKLYDVKVERAVGKGENYGSNMFRVTLKYIQGSEHGFRYAIGCYCAIGFQSLECRLLTLPQI